MLVLAERANEKTSTCWPSVTTIAQEAAMDERTVYRVLVELEAMGEISVERKMGRTNRFTRPPVGRCPCRWSMAAWPAVACRSPARSGR